MAAPRRLSVMNVGNDIGTPIESGGGENIFKAMNKTPMSKVVRTAALVSKKQRSITNARNNDDAVEKHLRKLQGLQQPRIEDEVNKVVVVEEEEEEGISEEEAPKNHIIEQSGIDSHGKRSTVVRILDVIDMAKNQNAANRTTANKAGNAHPLAGAQKEQNMLRICNAIGMPVALSRSMDMRMLSEPEYCAIHSNAKRTADGIGRSRAEQQQLQRVRDDYVETPVAWSRIRQRRKSSTYPIRTWGNGELLTSHLLSLPEIEGLTRDRTVPWRDLARLKKWSSQAHDDLRETHRKINRKQTHRKRSRSLDFVVGASSHRPRARMIRMVHELRADFDPLYRLSIVRDKLQAAIRYRWGDRFGEETLYWERLHEVVKIFGEVAIDRSGMVTRGEFARAFHSCTGEKIANSDLDNLLELCDPNDRGCLDLVEFARWYGTHADEWVKAPRRSDPEDEFNDQHLLRREILSFNPSLQSKIAVFWQLLNPVIDDTIAAEEEDDEDEHENSLPRSATIRQEKYLEFNMNLQRFVALNLQKEPFNEEIAIKVALREWEFDTRPRMGEDESASTSTTMTKVQFFRAMLQLVEAWSTVQADEMACHLFLDNLLKENTMLCQTPFGGVQRMWKWNSAVVQRRLLDLKKNESRLRNLKAAVRSRRMNRPPPNPKVGGGGTNDGSSDTPSNQEDTPSSQAGPAIVETKQPEHMEQGVLDKTAARFSRRFSIYRNESKRLNELREFTQSKKHLDTIEEARQLVHSKGMAGEAVVNKLGQQESALPRSEAQTKRSRLSMVFMPTRSSSMKVLEKEHHQGTTGLMKPRTTRSPAGTERSGMLAPLKEGTDDSEVANVASGEASNDDKTDEVGLDGAIQGLSLVLSMSSDTGSKPLDHIDDNYEFRSADQFQEGRRYVDSPGLQQLRTHVPASPPTTIDLQGRGVAGSSTEDSHALSVGPHVPSAYAPSPGKTKLIFDTQARAANAARNSFRGRSVEVEDAFRIKQIKVSVTDRSSTSVYSNTYESPSTRPRLYWARSGAEQFREDSKWLPQEDSLRQELDYSEYIAQYDEKLLTREDGRRGGGAGTVGEKTNSIDGTHSFDPGASQFSGSASMSRARTISTTSMFRKMISNLFAFLDVHQRGMLGQLELLALRSELFTTRLFIVSTDAGERAPNDPSSDEIIDDSGRDIVTINQIFDDITNSQRFDDSSLGLQRCILATVFTNASRDIPAANGDSTSASSSRGALLDALEALARRVADSAAKVERQGPSAEGISLRDFDGLMRKSEPPPDLQQKPKWTDAREVPAVTLQPVAQHSEHIFRDPREYSDGLVRSLLPPHSMLTEMPPYKNSAVCIMNIKPRGFSKLSTMYGPRTRKPPNSRPSSSTASMFRSTSFGNDNLSRSVSSNVLKYR